MMWSISIHKIIIPLFVSVLFAATSAAQSATPVVVVDDFLKAWNSHDAKAFDRLFTENAIWVPVAERRVVGHSDVIKDFEQIHTTWAKKTAIIARDIKIENVRPDVAVILFHAKFVQALAQTKKSLGLHCKNIREDTGASRLGVWGSQSFFV